VLVGSLLHACQANDQHMLVLLDSNNMLMLGLIAAINKSLLGSTYTKISAYWAIMQQMVLYAQKFGFLNSAFCVILSKTQTVYFWSNDLDACHYIIS
jgi:hypothetical protein